MSGSAALASRQSLRQLAYGHDAKLNLVTGLPLEFGHQHVHHRCHRAAAPHADL
jgi:hypothetical protein